MSVKYEDKDKCQETGQMTVEKILLSKIDIKAGKMTFGERIDLGKIFQTDQPAFLKMEQVFECLHKYTPLIEDYNALMPYFEEIVNGIEHWIIQEQEKLKYAPTAEEISAGIMDLSNKIGYYGTVKALAKTYGKDPDEILKWEYAKVFGILYTDLEEHRFSVAYNKVLENKYKRARR